MIEKRSRKEGMGMCGYQTMMGDGGSHSKICLVMKNSRNPRIIQIVQVERKLNGIEIMKKHKFQQSKSNRMMWLDHSNFRYSIVTKTKERWRGLRLARPSVHRWFHIHLDPLWCACWRHQTVKELLMRNLLASYSNSESHHSYLSWQIYLIFDWYVFVVMWWDRRDVISG